MTQLSQIVEAINERGQHIVLYGERGVGKTSLANIVNEKLQGILAAKVTCNRTKSFKNIWEEILKNVTFYAEHKGIGFQAVHSERVQLDLFLSPKEEQVDSANILFALERVTNPLLLIFDEFDSVAEKETKMRFADTLKALSDNAPHVTLLVVGIGDSVTELVGDHASNERCIKQVRLPRMSPVEIEEIVINGFAKLLLNVDPDVRLDLIQFSYGFPHYAHLLAKYSAKAAIEGASLDITRQHFNVAVAHAIENAQESIRDSYQKAVITTRNQPVLKNLIAACALVREDEHGTFRAIDIEAPLSKIAKKRYKLRDYAYHLGKLCNDVRGSVMQKVGPKNQHRYRFRNPLIKAYVRLKLYQQGEIEGVVPK